MEQTQASENKTGGYSTEPDFLRSKIYVSDTSHDQEKKHTFETNNSCHFYHILTSPYSQDMINECKGRVNCFNCNRAIQKKIYFYVMDFNPQMVPEFNVKPHCCKSCVLRSVQDIKNNHHLLTNFYLHYGDEVVCAPPRFLLYLPGASIEDYHKMSDSGMWINEEELSIRSFIAPVYTSCTFLKDHQIVKDVAKLIDEYKLESKTSVGPTRVRDNSKLEVTEISQPDLSNGSISKVFNIDSASYRN
jgi:hypothetical protein